MNDLLQAFIALTGLLLIYEFTWTFRLIWLWLSEQKLDMFAHKLKFILLPQLIATLNNYACSLPPMAKVDWFAFPECFLLTM